MTDRPKRPRDANQLAKFIVDLATDGESSVPLPDHEAQREGGIRGGHTRSIALSGAEKKAIAVKGASARWKKGLAAQEKKERS